ncbi:MAG: ATP-grasp domain-containing protein [Candidatus Yonathbacteria bacterium]|nr:ATP-grasp domain-containing protein [Candidatus Yonathbacteria bacterium]
MRNTRAKKDKILWVIGGGQLQVPLIEEAKKLGLTTLVTDKNANCVAKEYADHFYPVDIFDIDGSIKLLFRLRQDGMNIIGVLAAGIDANVTAAIVAKVASLPGVDPQAAYLTHYKHAFRKFLRDHNLPSPQWAEVSTLGELKESIKRIGVPFIIKNIDNSGSRGTKKFFSIPGDKELAAALEDAMANSSTKRALIEELLSGTEQTVETLYDVDGVFHPCFITDREFDPRNEWAVEIGLRHPTVLSLAIQKRLYSVTKKTADFLGITIGAAKVDMILTKKGPVIIEMTTRLSGGFDSQYLVPVTTGKNILRAAILTAIGKRFPKELLIDKKHRVGVTGSLWPKPGKIVSVKGIDEARKIPGVEYIFFRNEIGDTVLPYTDSAKRVCFIIATGKDESDARDILNRALKIISIITR